MVNNKVSSRESDSKDAAKEKDSEFVTGRPAWDTKYVYHYDRIFFAIGLVVAICVGLVFLITQVFDQHQPEAMMAAAEVVTSSEVTSNSEVTDEPAIASEPETTLESEPLNASVLIEEPVIEEPVEETVSAEEAVETMKEIEEIETVEELVPVESALMVAQVEVPTAVETSIEEAPETEEAPKIIPSSPAPTVPRAEILYPEQVGRALFAVGVKDLEPTALWDESVVFQADEKMKVLYFFTEISNMKGEQVTHVWYLNDKVIARVPINVGGYHWRCYSSKKILNTMEGQWRVEVVHNNGDLLAQGHFEVLADL